MTKVEISNREGRSDSASSRALRLVVYDGLASEVMATLTTGVYLTGFALELGAGNSVVGVIAAVPFLAQILQIPAVALIERWRARRTICVWASGIGRLFLLGTALAPALPRSVALAWLVLCLTVYHALSALSGAAWSSWIRDLVPPDQLGRFFGGRTAATTALAVVLGFVGGLAIDAWRRHVPGAPAVGYAVLFALGGLAGLLGVVLLARTPEPPMPPASKPMPLHRLLAMPFRDRVFLRLIRFLAAWNFAVNLAAPFFTVYLLQTLGYPMALVMTLNIVSQLSNLAFLAIWGRLIDRFNNKSVLSICAPLFIVCMVAWTFTGVEWMQPVVLPLLFLLHALMGLSTAGIALASGNLAMKLSPSGEATAYLAANSVVTAVAAGVAPIIGGACADFFAVHELTLLALWKSATSAKLVEVFDLHALTFFFALTALIGLYALHRLSWVTEMGIAQDRAVLQSLLIELRRSMHGISTIAGLVRLARFPAILLRRS